MVKDNKMMQDLTKRLDIEKIEWTENLGGVFDQVDIKGSSIDVIWYTPKVENAKGPNGVDLVRPIKNSKDGAYEIGFTDPDTKELDVFTSRDLSTVVNKIVQIMKKEGVK